ncbi:unnamed protein product [Schistosoma mattheei]|uniref:Uncharacterized protein n=1 Tax=Schistosoma mattheei TaxID=31246 RepID=A0A183P2F5_9TREM|nr:unnamed protein product [Schistosoma mattheei]
MNMKLINKEELSLLADTTMQLDCIIEIVPIQIQVIDRHGPVFDKPHYNFKIGQRSPIGSIVGQIQAIEEVNQPRDYSNTAICSYRLEPVDSPFSINNYGVIRVREALLSLAQRPYSLQVIAEDCSRPVPHRTSVSVTIEQILIDCKPGWKSHYHVFS